LIVVSLGRGLAYYTDLLTPSTWGFGIAASIGTIYTLRRSRFDVERDIAVTLLNNKDFSREVSCLVLFGWWKRLNISSYKEDIR
jgi:hypothetical protein